jgi:hypothetical protein
MPARAGAIVKTGRAIDKMQTNENLRGFALLSKVVESEYFRIALKRFSM